MNAGIVIFPGINRERDMAIALERSLGPQAAHGLAHARPTSAGSIWS